MARVTVAKNKVNGKYGVKVNGKFTGKYLTTKSGAIAYAKIVRKREAYKLG